VTFECRRQRFRFRARDPLYFPDGKSGNILRGALGTVLDAAIFSPRGTGPSGLADPPRPFVLRASHLDGVHLPAGAPFHFDLHLFDVSDNMNAQFARAVEEVTRTGIGPGRGRADLVEIEALPAPPIPLDIPEPAQSVRLQFLTPTELKSGEALVERPEFAVLFARLRDRISTLRALYGSGPLEIDFRAMAARAAQIRITDCALQRVSLDRRSSRTGQTHPLGGFTGAAEYTGPLGEFVPYLRAGEWTGVGRQTVWGKGAFTLQVRK
jgi:hypothetical protein